MRIPLIGGAYATRSIIAEAQLCINYFPESNPKTALSPVTYYQRPGLVPLVQGPVHAPVRAIYRASNGNGYCVIGNFVYSISPTWVLTNLGQLLTARTNPVILTDNGLEIMLVDGSQQGYTIDLGTNNFALIVDDAFTGATGVDTIDTFCLWNFPGTNKWGSTLSNQIVPLDPTYIAAKADYPDPLMRLIVNRHEILLIGALKSEIWYDAGNALFPFAELPGAYIEHGTCAPYSVASADISVFWLSQDLQGVGYVMRQRGYDTTIISNYALSVAIRKMADSVGISDAIGYTYTQDGHAFYVLSFPAGNQTWVYDDSIGDPLYGWHQRCWTDGQGVLQRDRTNCQAYLYGKNVVGDWENGILYALDLNTYSDTVDGVKYVTSYIRTFSHVGQGTQAPRVGQMLEADGKRMTFQRFTADIESGAGPGQLPLDANNVPSPDEIWLSWSNDRGKTFGEPVKQSNGAPGEWLTQPKWDQTGQARDRVFRLEHSIDGPAALNGAWIEVSVDNT